MCGTRCFDPFSNLIEVYVNRLRRKIDADSNVPLLHTRRGAGYLFGPQGENTRASDRGGARRAATGEEEIESGE